MEQYEYHKGRRLRMFAGPNGSGKSIIFSRIDSKFDVGFYINPDNLDDKLKKEGQIFLSDFGIKRNLDSKFNSLVISHSIAKKAKADKMPIDLIAHNGIISQLGLKIHSYNSAFLSDFLRSELVRDGKKLSFETVMSHESKLDFLQFASENGYKNYLYFISTASPDINVERVKLRVKENGHDVEEGKVRSRYENTMNLLFSAVKRCYRSFIFDNSGKDAKLICEIDNLQTIKIHTNSVPYWVYRYLLEGAKQSYNILKV